MYSVLKLRERPREFRISTVELEFLFQVFYNIPVTEFIRSTVNLESGFNGRSYGSTIVTFLAPNREGKLINHFNQALTRFISTTRSQVRCFSSHVT